MEKIIEFEFEKETKGAIRFKEIVPEGEDRVVGTLYVRKSFLGSLKPEKMTITLRFEEK